MTLYYRTLEELPIGTAVAANFIHTDPFAVEMVAERLGAGEHLYCLGNADADGKRPITGEYEPPRRKGKAVQKPKAPRVLFKVVTVRRSGRVDVSQRLATEAAADIIAEAWADQNVMSLQILHRVSELTETLEEAWQVVDYRWRA